MADANTLARRLREAYAGPTIAPLRDGLDPNDTQMAYDVQAINTAFWQDQGRTIVGRKIGLTSKVVQDQFGVDQPDFGVLFDDMQLQSGAVLSPARLLQPKVEAEVAIILGQDLGDGPYTKDDIAAATDCAAAAIEVVDSRISDWAITFADTVADNGSSAFFVLSDQRKPLDSLDLYTCGMVMEVNGAIVSHGVGAACMGHPLNSAAWLANLLYEQGAPLKAGDVLMTGALGPMAPLAVGDHVTARIGGLGHVQVSLGTQ